MPDLITIPLCVFQLNHAFLYVFGMRMAAGLADDEAIASESLASLMPLDKLKSIFKFYANFGRTSVMTHQNTLVRACCSL